MNGYSLDICFIKVGFHVCVCGTIAARMRRDFDKNEKKDPSTSAYAIRRSATGDESPVKETIFTLVNMKK